MSPGVRLLLAILSGALLAVSFPDYSLGWCAFIALVPLLVAVVRAQRAREALFLGWLSQFVAWLLMVPWVIRVMSHYGGLPYLTGVLIFVAMCAYLAVYGALFAVSVWVLRPGRNFGAWLMVPLAWAAVEFVRTHVLSGFPWSLIATAIIDYTPLVQLARFAGPYLVGCLVLLPSVVMAWILTQRPPAAVRFLVAGATLAVMFIWSVTGYVAARMRGSINARPSAVAALLQPNISQEMRWDDANLLAIYQKMMSMTERAIRAGAGVVIWPESTVPLSYSTTPFYREAIESVSRTHDADIILGSVAEESGDRNRLWNAAFLVSSGRTIGHYDKIHLVPFGEYVPMRKMLFFAETLVRGVGDFTFGTSDHPLRGKFAYGPAICYEIVFPQITRNQVRHGADVLVTITNDAWYDGTSAPRQHLNQARLRAVEDDRWLLRAATSGISAVVDPTGRIIQQIPMGRDGTIYARFEPRTTITPYVRYGDWFAWVSAAVVCVAMMMRRMKNLERSVEK